MPRVFTAVFAVSSCLGLACGEHRDDSPFGSTLGTESGASTTGPGTASAGSESSTTGAGTTSASSGSTDSATTDGIKFDIGGDGDMTAGGDGGFGKGCDKIDFLFVVDNSGSMGAHQTALINSFGPFIDTIFDTVEAQDFQIMVVDSDADGDISGACEPCSPNSFWCGDWCTAKNSLDVACEKTLGAGEVAPYNNGASNKICGVPDGKRYLTSQLSKADIKDKFACMAKVGVFGSGAELPMSAMVAAVTTQNQAGGCNPDFVRKDSVLVVTVITDDYPVSGTADDASTVGSPQAWYDAVVQAKNGNSDHVVMLGIINTADATCVDGAGGPPVHPTQRFVDLVQLFGSHGFVGNICSSDYNAFFEQAVAIIDTACDEFTPEG